MSDVAISVEGISKRYRIGTAADSSDSILGSISQFAKSPIRNLMQLRKLSKFGTDEDQDDVLWALRDVSFEVQQGEVIGIVGSNGAGKSTLLKVLSRITDPTEGRVTLRGRIASLLEVGTGFHPDLTGRDNIYLNGTILGMTRKEIRDQFDGIVEFADIGRFIDTPVKRYSSGMRVRLGFAVAAHLQPEILMVDEVLSVGDASFQRKSMNKITGISKEGRTVLFVSHNMAALLNICTRGVYLKDGKVAATGSISEVISAYLDVSDQSTQGGRVWASPEEAPGDYRLRLKSIRVVGSTPSGTDLKFEDEFRVEIEFWNLVPGRRGVSVHLKDSKNQVVLTSGNIPMASVQPDPWHDRTYPEGIFSTTCVIPGHLLNSGTYYLSIFVRGSFTRDTIVREPDILSFTLTDHHLTDREFTGEWVGVLRTKLDWHTTQVE